MNYFKLILLATIVTVITNQITAQKPPIKFGKVSMDEMNMTVYDKDTTAEAVVLADYGVSEILYNTSNGFELNFKTHVRIKILKKEGLDKANVTVNLYQSSTGSDEKFGALKAVTYNLVDGKIAETKLPKKDVFTEEESKNWKLKKFALPDVKVGSVIEYQYTKRSPFIYNFQPWYFQSDIPMIWSEYRTLIPEYFEYKKVFGGYLSPTISEKKTGKATLTISTKTKNNRKYVGPDSYKGSEMINYQTFINRWVYKDVPAFKNEKYITAAKDYLAKVEFELQSTKYPNSHVKTYTTTWNAIVNDLLTSEYFGAPLNRKGIVKELTEQINPNDTVEKKLIDAYYLIKKHVKWNGKNTRYIDNTLRAAFNKNEGNTAEINLLLVNLLRSVGVESYPVLISTRGFGKINRFYARKSAFNSVIALARIDGKSILMDATIAYLKPGELPFKDLNGQGLVAVKNNAYWIPLLGNEQVYNSSMVMATIKDEKLTAQIARSYKSLSATIKRGRIAKEGKEKYIENYKEKNSDWEIGEHSFKNEEDATKTLGEKIMVENFDNIDVSDDMIYLPAILTDEETENPFSSETREYPVDFATPIYEKNVINIVIPEGYQVEELPKPTKVVLPNSDASFIYNAQKAGANIQVMSRIVIKKTLFLPQEYHLLKELYRNIIEKYGEQIVLKKIEE